MSDFWSDISGGRLHTGSWGTPDAGVTEWLADRFGQSRNDQGGSQLSAGTVFAQPNQQYVSNNVAPSSTSYQYTQLGGPGGGGGSTSNSSSSTQQNTQQNTSGNKPNRDTTYYTINGETKKLGDWIGQGVLDENGNIITSQQPQSQWNDQYGMYEDQIQGAINDAYSGTQNYLNQAEGAVRANLPGQLGEITSAADLQKAKLGEGRQSILDTIATNERGAQTRKEDALAAARRLYQELGQANIQRFGGSTSAGQAMSELQGREQQYQMGQTNRQYNEYMNQAATQKATLDREYQTGLQTIESEKQKATNAVNQAFQQSLLDIARDRATNESAKAQARLSALQDLRNKMFQISQQETQFKQSLEAQKQAAQLQIDSYLKTQGAASTGINNAYSQFNAGTQQALNPQTKYALQNMGVGQLQQPMYIGSIGKSITGRDENGNYIYSDGINKTSGPGGFLNQ